jgi:hypothetical protein
MVRDRSRKWSLTRAHVRAGTAGQANQIRKSEGCAWNSRAEDGTLEEDDDDDNTRRCVWKKKQSLAAAVAVEVDVPAV